MLGTSIGANIAVSANNPCAANPRCSLASVVVPAVVVVPLFSVSRVVVVVVVATAPIRLVSIIVPIRARPARALDVPARRISPIHARAFDRTSARPHDPDRRVAPPCDARESIDRMIVMMILQPLDANATILARTTTAREFDAS